MPNRDGKGPQGRGAMTGRGMGSCKGEQKQDKQGQNISFGSGQGKRCGKGMKRGLGNRWNSIEESKEKNNKEE